MGLDMYLVAEKYVSGWDFTQDEEEKHLYKHLCELVGVKGCPGSPSAYIRVTVAYWRKANAIHGWFVKNVQGGNDECQESYVSRDQLHELLNVAKKVAELYDDGKKDEAGKMLSPTPGFFFGGYEIDEYYRDDLKDTIEQLEAALKLSDVDFYYRASW